MKLNMGSRIDKKTGHYNAIDTGTVRNYLRCVSLSIHDTQHCQRKHTTTQVCHDEQAVGQG